MSILTKVSSISFTVLKHNSKQENVVILLNFKRDGKIITLALC